MLAAGGVPASEIRDGVGLVYKFLGFDVALSQVMPAAEANSQVCCLLGEFTLGAVFGDRGGEEVEFSDVATVGGQSLWERDELGVRGKERYDIAVHGYGTSAVAGPIVGLQTAAS